VGEPQNSEWAPGPQFKFRPPLRGLGPLERPRLENALTAAADAHRLTLVAAPAGYGKSTLLGDWVRKNDLQCAWLSLDRFDTQPARLFHGVVGAIQAAAGQVSNPAIVDPVALHRQRDQAGLQRMAAGVGGMRRRRQQRHQRRVDLHRARALLLAKLRPAENAADANSASVKSARCFA